MKSGCVSPRNALAVASVTTPPKFLQSGLGVAGGVWDSDAVVKVAKQFNLGSGMEVRETWSQYRLSFTGETR